MGKVLDYLEWRGDLRFSKDPVNVIDILLLSLLSYLPFKGIIPGIESNDDISLKETSDQYFSKISIARDMPSAFNPTASTSFDAELVKLLKFSATCPRFEEIRLSKYDENIDFVIGRQFGALTFKLNNNDFDKIVAFRGTDNSLIGWKEDFELAYLEQIPAQEYACTYLERTIGGLLSSFTVCGHSKGGNLAVYAGSHLNPLRQGRIKKIINFDGPGFDFSVMKRSSFTYKENQVYNYIPEESMVGLLLNPLGKRTVVSSSARLINQHNALNWKVERTKFVPGKLTNTAKILEQTLQTWLTEISLSERKLFLEALFDILGASEGAAITYDPQENLKAMKNILSKYSKLNIKTKALLAQVFFSLSNQTRKTITIAIKEKLPRIN